MESSSNDHLSDQPAEGAPLVPLAGSERETVEERPALSAAALPADAPITATVVVRRRAPLAAETVTAGTSDPEEYAATYGADPADLDRVAAALAPYDISVETADQASRRLRIAGTAAAMGRAFGTTLSHVTRPDPAGGTVTHRQRSGPLQIPAELDGIVTAVLGLDDRPQGATRFRLVRAAADSTTTYTPLDLAKIYRFPAGTDGSGQTIAILELGGGFAQSDLDTYFGGLGITGPTVTAVGVDGATNVPGKDPEGADGEVLLDIEVAGALAPGAAIVVYFAPNTDAGFLDALSQAVHATPPPAVVSISWGQSEEGWTGQAKTAFDEALADAAALGVTVTVAAGDDGSTDRGTDSLSHVDFPASSPHSLACGGTRLEADIATGTIRSETVWNEGTGRGATGGGVSNTFDLPDWQAHVGVPARADGKPGRGVPDVAADADPQTGYRVLVDGSSTIIGGTSAVSPLWAALVARLVQGTGRRLGLLQPALYAQATAGTVAAGFRDITDGNNGAFTAAAGWDPCTGLGVPDGEALLAALRGTGGTGSTGDNASGSSDDGDDA